MEKPDVEKEHIASATWIVETVRRIEWAIRDAHENKEPTAQALHHTISQQAWKWIIENWEEGKDQNVYFGELCALGMTCWVSFVTEAKARNGSKDKEYREGYWKGHIIFREDIDEMIKWGEGLVELFMKERGDDILPRPVEKD